MNEARTRGALKQLAEAAHELGSVCDREAPEYGPVWHRIASNAEALEGSLSRSDLESLLNTVASLFGFHPGAFSEVYIVRADFAEQEAENARFDALKERVSAAAGEAREAAKEGEVNTLAVRRHLTTLETVLLETNHQAEAARARKLLSADELDCMAAAHFAGELEARKWTRSATARVPAIIDALKAELAPYVVEARR